MKIRYIIAALALGSTSLTGCSLDEDLSSFTSPTTFYATKAQCESALNAVYNSLNPMFNYQFMLAVEACTDIGYCNGSDNSCRLIVSPSTAGIGQTVWTQGYKGVVNANSAIAGIENATVISESDRNQMVGEGKVMRAFYYHLLTSFFGDVPFYTQAVVSREEHNKVSQLPRMSAYDTRDSLIHDLQRCVPLMAQRRTSEEPDNRSGAAMGWMLIAKMAMWNEQWDTAIEAIEKLESLYGDLMQYPLEDVWFRNKNTPESIFEIQHTYTAGGLAYTSNVACVGTPPRTAGTCIYGGVEMPELGDQSTIWGSVRPTTYFHATLMYEGSGDKREGQWIIHSTYNGMPLTGGGINTFGPKFWCPGMRSSRDSNNYKIFRYADALLLKAECYFHKGDRTNCIEYLNKVKRRAGLKDYAFRNEARLWDEIMDERGRELLGEFKRKFDLVRWGVWYERTSSFNERSDVKNNIQPYHEYYPIPDVEVAYSHYILDNKAYEKGSTDI